jgi:hypothetical protein
MVMVCEQPGGGGGMDLWCVCGYSGGGGWTEAKWVGVGGVGLLVVVCGLVVGVWRGGLALSAQGVDCVGVMGAVFHLARRDWRW